LHRTRDAAAEQVAKEVRFLNRICPKTAHCDRKFVLIPLAAGRHNLQGNRAVHAEGGQAVTKRNGQSAVKQNGGRIGP
jgi:hypothetical protein